MTHCLCGSPVEFWMASAKGRVKWYCKRCGIMYALSKELHQQHMEIKRMNKEIDKLAEKQRRPWCVCHQPDHATKYTIESAHARREDAYAALAKLANANPGLICYVLFDGKRK